MAEDAALITMLEIRRLQRAAVEDVRRRMAAGQLAEAFEPPPDEQQRRTA